MIEDRGEGDYVAKQTSYVAKAEKRNKRLELSGSVQSVRNYHIMSGGRKRGGMPASSRRRIRTEKKRVSERNPGNPGYSLQLLFSTFYSNSILPAIDRPRQRVRLLRGDELIFHTRTDRYMLSLQLLYT